MESPALLVVGDSEPRVSVQQVVPYCQYGPTPSSFDPGHRVSLRTEILDLILSSLLTYLELTDDTDHGGGLSLHHLHRGLGDQQSRLGDDLANISYDNISLN